MNEAVKTHIKSKLIAMQREELHALSQYLKIIEFSDYLENPVVESMIEFYKDVTDEIEKMIKGLESSQPGERDDYLMRRVLLEYVGTGKLCSDTINDINEYLNKKEDK